MPVPWPHGVVRVRAPSAPPMRRLALTQIRVRTFIAWHRDATKWRERHRIRRVGHSTGTPHPSFITRMRRDPFSHGVGATFRPRRLSVGVRGWGVCEESGSDLIRSRTPPGTGRGRAERVRTPNGVSRRLATRRAVGFGGLLAVQRRGADPPFPYPAPRNANGARPRGPRPVPERFERRIRATALRARPGPSGSGPRGSSRPSPASRTTRRSSSKPSSRAVFAMPGYISVYS